MFPARYLIPNSVTALSMFLAMGSIIQALGGAYKEAAWLIVWCVLLDRLDGIAARIFKATSSFGLQFDSLTDLLAFCVTPAILVYSALTRDPRYAAAFQSEWLRMLLFAAVGGYVILGALRLARYNIGINSTGPDWFRGLPTTIAGALVSTSLLAAWELRLPNHIVMWSPVLLLGCGVLMISNLWLRKNMRPASPILTGLMVLGIVAVYALGSARLYPTVIWAAILSYPLFGFLIGAFRHPRPDTSASGD